MGTIADKIAYTKQAREEIRAAIVAKGVDCPGSAPFCTFDEYINSIETGGGSSEETKVSAVGITFPTLKPICVVGKCLVIEVGE